MSKARFILIALICLCPIALLWDGLAAQGLLAAIIAVALAITALTLPPGETKFLLSVIFFAALFAAIPALWILFQLLPLSSLAHPIWASAQAALGHRVIGGISVDLGSSLIGLGRYLFLCAVVLVAAAVGIDRSRAESLLFALAAASTIIASLSIAYHLLAPNLEFSPFTQEQATDGAALGVIFASAAGIRAFDRYKSPYRSPQRSIPVWFWTFIACCVALAICSLALLIDGTWEIFVATGCGFAALACVMIIRRFRLGVWGLVGFAAGLLAVAFYFSSIQPIGHGKNVLLAFASSAASPSDISERVLKDAPLVGTGLRTFPAMAQIYREIDDPQPRPVASTAAANFAIELGRPMLWLIVVATLGFVVVFLLASLRRGRDSFYPAMGGSCLLTLLLLGFINAGVLGIAVGALTAAMLGLAIAQRKSRTANP